MGKNTFVIEFAGITASKTIYIKKPEILDGFWSDANGAKTNEGIYGEKVKFTVATKDIDDGTVLNFTLYDYDGNYNPDDELSRSFSTKVKGNMAELEFIPDIKWEESAKYETDKVVETYFKIESDIKGKKISKKLPKKEDEYLKILRKRQLFLLYYVTGNDHGDEMFAEAAQTRLQNIKNTNGFNNFHHKVHCIPIQDISEIISITKTYIKKYGGDTMAYCQEVGIWSHSGFSDGPIGSSKTLIDSVVPVESNQMKISGWSKIKFNWLNKESLFVMYGCNSGRDDTLFAQKLSFLPNFKDIDVWGQSDSSYPSKFPDYRRTSLARTFDEDVSIGGFEVGHTYMVAGNDGEGKKSQTLNLLDDYPKANPMNCYKNGSKVRSMHQGYFNDHRKAKKRKMI
jgi:hypothetical protein